jgi:antirestriction protein ArdC
MASTDTPSRYEAYTKDYSEMIAQAIEKGVAPWQRPWAAGVVAAPGEGMPFNAISGKGYSGSNALRLMMEQQLNGYADDRWLTYQQATALGGQVRKGQKGTQCVRWIDNRKDEKEPDAADRGDRKPGMFPVLFTVFNGDQIDNMPPAKVREMPGEQWRHEKAEGLIKDSGAEITHGGNRACYIPALDAIRLPHREQFGSADGYFATALHELGHWTGKEGRLGRDMSGNFGSKEYAHEELTAEISSMMVGDRLGIGHDPAQHVAYVHHWAQIIRDDPKAIFKACSNAEKVCSFLRVERYEHVAEQVQEGRFEQPQELAARPAKNWSPSTASGQAVAARIVRNSGRGRVAQAEQGMAR